MIQPWLSVVMPTHNGAEHLGDALDSIAGQDTDGVEVIAVDDGSTDATLSILQSFAERLPLRVICVAHSGNWVANTNVGLREATGEYACFLHQDDVWLAGRLAALHGITQRLPEAGLVIHPVRFIDKSGRDVGPWTCPLAADEEGLKPDDVLERMLVQNFIAVPGTIFRRELALQCGAMDEALWYTADWDLWLKLAAASERVVYHAEPLAAFRVHASSQTLRRTTSGSEFRKQLDCVLQRHLPAWEARHPDRSDIARVARFSIDVNAALAAAAHGQRADWLPLAMKSLWLGPLGWKRYLRDSRLWQRVRARRRAGL